MCGYWIGIRLSSVSWTERLLEDRLGSRMERQIGTISGVDCHYNKYDMMSACGYETDLSNQYKLILPPDCP